MSSLLIFSCTKPVPPKNAKVLVTIQGEITEDTRYPGDLVTFKIYYGNTSKKPGNIVIVDTLDTLLTDVIAQNGGTYDPAGNTIQWEINDVAGYKGGSVTFQANIKNSASAGSDKVTNRAAIYFEDAPLKPGIGKKPVDGQPGPLTKKGRRIVTNIVTINICNNPDLGWIPFEKEAKPNDKPKKVLKEETTMGTMVYFSIPGMFVREVKRQGNVFHTVSVPTLSMLGDLGKPDVPVIGKAMEIARNVKVTVEVYKVDSVIFNCYNLLPAQIPEIEGGDTSHLKFQIDPATYAANALYPDKRAFIRDKDDGIIRGHRIVFPKAAAMRFNPVTKELVAYTKIEIRIKYDTPAQKTAVNKRIVSQRFEEILHAAVENHKDIEMYEHEEDEGGPGDNKRGCDYLVITPSAFYSNDSANPIQRLCAWKHQKGLLTNVETIESIGNADSSIRAFMQNAYNSWYPVPTYVVLIGDANHIVPSYVTEHTADGHRVAVGTPNEHRTRIGTDLYYTTLDGTDYFPDVMLSRISVNDTNDVAHIVDKLLEYERTPPANANFYTTTPLARLFEDDTDNPTDPSPSDGREDDVWVLIERAEEMRDALVADGYTVDRIYNFSGGWAQGPQQWNDGTNLPDHLTQQPPTVFAWNGNTNDIAAAFNNGTFMITYRGHGGRGGWSRPSFRTGDFGLLNQNNLYPAVFCPTCQTGWFDDETDDPLLNSPNDCFAEELLRRDNCGAICVFASSRNSWGAYNNPMLQGICDALWPDFDPDIAGGYLPRTGQFFVYAKTFMATVEPHSTGRLITFEMTHLFGDPELPLWIELPGELSVVHPEGIGSTAKQEFVVKVTDKNTGVAVQSATVALTRPNKILKVEQTDAGGYAWFSLSSPGAGDIAITVTSLKHRPFINTIKAAANGAVINILNPDNGSTGQEVYIGGQQFDDSEKVDIYFGATIVKTPTASGAGEFGQANDASFNVPAGAGVGPVTIMAKGRVSKKYATKIFTVRTAKAVELYTYSQWDESTWHLHAGDNPVWNNPELWLEETGGAQVASNNLVVGTKYIIKARVHNSSDNDATAAKVTFKWAEYGAGQQVWTDIATSAPVNVAHDNSQVAQVEWTPLHTGHICVTAQIYHAEDVLNSNNKGQENCHVGPTASPAVVPMQLCNPLKEPAMVFLELRQIDIKDPQSERNPMWGSAIKQPEPQLLKPGECRTIEVILDPDLAKGKVASGQVAKFALTAYIKGKMIGGANFEIKKK